MRKGMVFTFGFLTGGGCAIFLANMFLKQKYEQKADEQIAACREAFLEESAKRRKEAEEKKAAETKAKAVEAIKTYSPEPEKAEEMLDKPDAKEPYEITEEIYRDPANPFASVGLTYFPNEGVVLRSNNVPMTMEEMLATIGRKSLALFSDEETDCVYIRNEQTKCDYEICVPNINYAEWIKRFPRK